MKKVLFMLVLAVLIAGGLWAQSDTKNWISGDISLIGMGLRYERMLTPKFSLGGQAFYNNFLLFFNSTIVSATGRFYPWAETFYIGLDLGFGSNFVLYGAAITPALGWKIDVGKPGAFFINPELSMPIVLGALKNEDGKSEFGFLGIPRASFGMGYAF
jgi:hypothetical protein